MTSHSSKGRLGIEIPIYLDPKSCVYTLRFTKEFLPHFRNLIRARAVDLVQNQAVRILRIGLYTIISEGT